MSHPYKHQKQIWNIKYLRKSYYRMLCDISIFVMTFVTLIPQMMIVANSLNVLSFITLPFFV